MALEGVETCWKCPFCLQLGFMLYFAVVSLTVLSLVVGEYCWASSLLIPQGNPYAEVVAQPLDLPQLSFHLSLG